MVGGESDRRTKISFMINIRNQQIQQYKKLYRKKSQHYFEKNTHFDQVSTEQTWKIGERVWNERLN